MPIIPDSFKAWVHKELAARNLSQSEGSRRAGLNQNAISDMVNDRVKGVSLRNARALARLFNTPLSEVLRLAGHIENLTDQDDLTLQELLALAKGLSEEDRRSLLDYARWKAGQRG